MLYLLFVRALRATPLLTAFLIVFSPPAFAALNINKAGDLTATDFDELGFDPTGLVGYWQLNGNAKDSSGYHNDGTIVGATATTDRFGVANAALSFNGTLSNYVDCGNGGSLNITAAISVVAWVNSNLNGYGRIVSKHGGGSNGWLLAQYQDMLECEISTNGTNWNGGVSSAGVFPLNQWIHVVATYDGSYIRVYINGVQKIGGNFPYALAGSINVAPGHTRIGRDNFGFNPWSGSIDEVKIFGRVLSNAEILAMYNHEKGKFSVWKDGTDRAVSFVEDPTLPVQMRSKKQSLTVKGHLIQQ